MLVLTKEDGYIMFKDITPYHHHVMAKDHRWHIVTRFFEQGKKGTIYVSGQGFESIHCTPNHKFWVRERKGKEFTKPHWKHANELNKDCWFGVPIIEEEQPFATDNEDFWYIMGAYIGDGWINKSSVDMKISCSAKKLANLREKFKIVGLPYTVNKVSDNCWNIRTHDKVVIEFVLKTFGTGSMEKIIPFEVLGLPRKQLMAFLEGYISADGCFYKNVTQFSTINPNIAYSFSLIVNKLFHRICNIYKIKVSPTKVIEGRTVNQRDYYQLKFKKEDSPRDSAFFENGYIWYRFRKSWKGEYEEVYDIEVDEDHSFTLNGCLVSNCQDLSNAGKRQGMERGHGTRSGLLWEVERILLELTEMERRPDVLLMENVPQVCGSANSRPWNDWLDSLYKMGYTNYFRILNAKDYGIPQNRERCFMVSILGEHSYEFPRKIRLRYRLRDFLDTEVGEKYYLSDKMTERFVATYRPRGYSSIDTYNRRMREEPETSGTLQAMYPVPNHGERLVEPVICASRGRNPDNPTSRKSGLPTEQMMEVKEDGTSNALTSVQKDNYVLEPRIELDGSLNYYGFGRADNVTSKEGISPTIITGGERIGHQVNIVDNKKVILGQVSGWQTSKILGSGGVSGTLMARDWEDPQKVARLGEEESEIGNVRIRKLSPYECGKLMGFDRSDFQKMSESGLSETALYHSAGDSIIVTVLMGLLGSLLQMDYASAIESVADRIAGEKGKKE